MEKPLVSTIIPCYKQAYYLPQAVESVLAQTYPNLEVIVVNDGSPDDTEDVMRAYADDPRVRLITQSNQGVAAARNRGIAAARLGDIYKSVADISRLRSTLGYVPIASSQDELAATVDAFTVKG